MATQKSKSELLDSIFEVTAENIHILELYFSLGRSKLTAHLDIFTDDSEKEALKVAAMEHFKTTEAYLRLNQIYDYAIDGVIDDTENYDLENAAIHVVLASKEVITLISAEDREPDGVWDMIIAMGDGRFSLDTGHNIDIYKVALLAGVDVRTVRNAISSGELTAEKVESMVFVDNRSAQVWLSKRRAFKPTRFISTAKKQLDEINTAIELGAFLKEKRESLGLVIPDEGLASDGSKITFSEMAQLETGVFNLPLNTVELMAEFYQLHAKELVQVIMRVFFPKQLEQLIGTQA